MSLTLSCLLSCHHYSSFEVFYKMHVAILSSMNIIKLFFLSFPGVNPCERSNGECEHLCVHLPSVGSRCLCEVNFQLNKNGKTCDKLELRGRLSLFLTRVDNRWFKDSSWTEWLATSYVMLARIENGLINGVIFIYLKEAFDTIDHSLLIRKVLVQVVSNGLKHLSATVAKNAA